MKGQTNFEVDRRSDHSDYCLSWELGDAHYHIWLESGTFKLRPALGVKDRTRAIYKRSPHSDDIQYLKTDVPKNRAMVDDAIAEAVANHLFEKEDQRLRDENIALRKRDAAAYAVTLAKEAGPQMLAVLKAIDEFWRGGDYIHPLSPGALIMDGDQTISDAVKAAIVAAEPQVHP